MSSLHLLCRLPPSYGSHFYGAVHSQHLPPHHGRRPHEDTSGTSRCSSGASAALRRLLITRDNLLEALRSEAEMTDPATYTTLGWNAVANGVLRANPPGRHRFSMSALRMACRPFVSNWNSARDFITFAPCPANPSISCLRFRSSLRSRSPFSAGKPKGEATDGRGGRRTEAYVALPPPAPWAALTTQ